MKNPQDILAFAMSMELQGQRFYERFADEVENPNARQWFETLAATEKEHYEILQREYNHWVQHHAWIEEKNRPSHPAPDLFNERRKQEKLGSGEASYSLTDLSILRMAYLIENDFALFYENAMEQITDPEGKKLLQTLFEWENEHRRLFHEAYQEAMKDHWFDQGFAPF